MMKTHLHTQAVAHVVLFSSDLELPYHHLIDYYRLRFQLEFNFRDAKQYWGLEDFMTVNETPGYNRANLAIFMVNVSHALMRPMHTHWPELSVNNSQASCPSKKYVVETLKLLPEMPEPIFIDQAIAQVARLGGEPCRQPPLNGEVFYYIYDYPVIMIPINCNSIQVIACVEHAK